MSKKIFTVAYEAKIKRYAIVFADDEEEAKKEFDKGNIQEESDADIIDVEFLWVEEDK